MYKSLIVALTVLLLATAAPLLSACHTTAGAGEDISATGHAITNSADRTLSLCREGRRSLRWRTR
jgi:predicted small secreted protein